jgi:hypothetical protein
MELIPIPTAMAESITLANVYALFQASQAEADRRAAEANRLATDQPVYFVELRRIATLHVTPYSLKENLILAPPAIAQLQRQCLKRLRGSEAAYSGRGRAWTGDSLLKCC